MTRLRMLVGFVAIVIAFAIFVVVSKPHDVMPALRPYISSHSARYTTLTRPGMSVMPVYEQTIIPHDLTSKKLADIVRTTTFMNMGYSASMGMSPTHSKTMLHFPMSTPVSGDAPVTKIVIWRGLRWNEILYARLTQLGRDPFR